MYMEEQPRRKRRSHEEAVAAREEYLKAREEKRQLREQKLLDRQKSKEQREQERLQKAEERLQYRLNLNAEREKKKEQRKRRRMSKKDLEGDRSLYPPYEGLIRVGDKVEARFAGSSIAGTVIEISKAKDVYSEEETVVVTTLYVILEGKIKYPVHKEDIYKKYE